MKTYRIIKHIMIDATPEAVFDALTTSEEIVKYYPLNQVISHWEIGDTVDYMGEVDGQAFTDYGVITQLLRPAVYSYRYWSDNHGTEKTPDNHLTINYKLTLINGATALRLVQDNIKSEAMYSLMNDIVWDMLLNGLKVHMEASV